MESSADRRRSCVPCSSGAGRPDLRLSFGQRTSCPRPQRDGIGASGNFLKLVHGRVGLVIIAAMVAVAAGVHEVAQPFSRFGDYLGPLCNQIARLVGIRP